nr:MAG TPA: hypothetical protein [Caudoviricetes sp.]
MTKINVSHTCAEATQRKKLLRNATIKALYERYRIGGNDE